MSRLFFILVIIQSSLVLSMKLLQDSSDKHVKEKHDLSHRLLKRQVQCMDGEYHAGKLCCKVCHKGTHAASDCTVAHGQPVCKACTEGVDFMDEENGYPECQGCRNCESDSGQEELHQCTIIQNTVCKCKKEFYCSESLSSADQHCNRCQRCTLCEDGVAEECTSTNDTVCKNSSNRNHVIAPVLGVIGVIGIIAIVFVVLKFCRKPRETEQSIVPPNKELPDSVPFIPKPTCPPELENIKLENHLLEISGLMVLQSVKLVTRHLTPVQLEEIKMNTQHNAREEKFELLKTWYYDHGSQGAFKMLLENCTNVEAEKILDLVQERNAEP